MGYRKYLSGGRGRLQITQLDEVKSGQTAAQLDRAGPSFSKTKFDLPASFEKEADETDPFDKKTIEECLEKCHISGPVPRRLDLDRGSFPA